MLSKELLHSLANDLHSGLYLRDALDFVNDS